MVSVFTKIFCNYIYGRKIYIDNATIKDIGRREWYSLLHEFAGALVIDRRNSIAVDILYMELVELFLWIFDEDVIERYKTSWKRYWKRTGRQGGKSRLQRLKMTQEDRDYFKKGVKTLCSIEVLITRDFINAPKVKRTLAKEDVEFMNKELGRQAGAVFAEILRGFKKMDLAGVQKALTGGKGE